MSSISKDNIPNSESDNQSNDNYLIFDFGLYPHSKELLSSLKVNKQNQVVELKPNHMKSSDWDHVLDLVIKNKKCLTL